MEMFIAVASLERKELQEEIDRLREENTQLRSQLRIQARKSHH
jgi:cell shape-determining protein MreC